jgi:hypothetical protein
MTDDRGADGLRYNRKGYLIPPQSEGVWAMMTGIYAMVIPLIVIKTAMRSPLLPAILQQQTCQVPNQHKGRSDRRRHAPVAPTATSALLHR